MKISNLTNQKIEEMKDFKIEAEKILEEFLYINNSRVDYSSAMLDALYQLHLEGVREIIGQDEEPVDFEPLTLKPMPDRWITGKNHLRAEQRQKLEGLQPKEYD